MGDDGWCLAKVRAQDIKRAHQKGLDLTSPRSFCLMETAEVGGKPKVVAPICTQLYQRAGVVFRGEVASTIDTATRFLNIMICADSSRCRAVYCC